MDKHLQIDIAVARALLDEVERQLGVDGRVKKQLVEQLSRVIGSLAAHAEPESGVTLRKAG